MELKGHQKLKKAVDNPSKVYKNSESFTNPQTGNAPQKNVQSQKDVNKIVDSANKNNVQQKPDSEINHKHEAVNRKSNYPYPYTNQNRKRPEEYEKILQYFDAAWRHKWLILLLPLLLLPIIYLYSIRKPITYSTDFDILIKNESVEFEVINNKAILKNQFDPNTWLRILKSTQVMSAINEKLKTPYSVASLKKLIEVSQEKDVENIFHIQVTALDPDEVVSIAKTYFNVLNEFDRNKLFETTNQVLVYLQNEIKVQNEKVADFDKKTVEYITENNVSGNQDLKSYYTKLDGYRQQLADINIELNSTSAHIAALESQLNKEAPSMLTETTFSEPLKGKLMKLEIELASSRTKYKNAHPKIIELENNIKYVKDMIKQGAQDEMQIKSISANPITTQLLQKLMLLKGNEVSLRSKRSAIKNLINDTEYNLERITNKSDRLSDIKARKKAVESLIDELNSKLYETQLKLKTISDRLVLLDQILPPGANSNGLKRNLILALIAGLGLGFLLAQALEMIDDRIKNVNEFQSAFNIPILGIVKHNKKNLFKTTTKNTDDSVTKELYNEFSSILVNFRYSINQNNEKVFAITSGLSEEGKSLNALNLAKVLANDGLKVLLLEADFWKHRLTSWFDTTNKPGLSSFLSFQADYDSVIHSTRYKNLKFTPSGVKPLNASKFFQSQKMNEFLRTSRSNFDIVLIDTPAVLFVPEIIHLFQRLDGLILIVKMFVSTNDSVRETLQKISVSGTDILGVVLNDVRHNFSDSNYNYYYKYYKKNKGYYSYHSDEDEDKTKSQPTLVKIKEKINKGIDNFGGFYEIKEDTKRQQKTKSKIAKHQKREESFGKWYQEFKGIKENSNRD